MSADCDVERGGWTADNLCLDRFRSAVKKNGPASSVFEVPKGYRQVSDIMELMGPGYVPDRWPVSDNPSDDAAGHEEKANRFQEMMKKFKLKKK